MSIVCPGRGLFRGKGGASRRDLSLLWSLPVQPWGHGPYGLWLRQVASETGWLPGVSTAESYCLHPTVGCRFTAPQSHGGGLKVARHQDECRILCRAGAMTGPGCTRKLALRRTLESCDASKPQPAGSVSVTRQRELCVRFGITRTRNTLSPPKSSGKSSYIACGGLLSASALLAQEILPICVDVR